MLYCNHFNNLLLPPTANCLDNGNRVTYSSLRECEMKEYTASTYSIKYVVQGTEHYFLNKQKFFVSAGNFLLVNRQEPLDVTVRSRKEVNGFCVHLKEDLLQEIYAQQVFDEEVLLDDPSLKANVPLLESLLYSDKENGLSYYLRKMATAFDSYDTTINIDSSELYHHLSRHLLSVQNDFSKAERLGVIRNSTKQELVRRLQLAKEVLEDRNWVS